MLSVGQKLWFVPRRGEAREVEVIKVGRKWAYVQGYRPDTRVDITTLCADGGGFSSPGQCHLDREAYETEVTRRKEWSDMVWRLRATATPSHLTLEDIREIRAKLQL